MAYDYEKYGNKSGYVYYDDYCQSWIGATKKSETDTTVTYILYAEQQLVGASLYGLRLSILQINSSSDWFSLIDYDDYWTTVHSDGDWYPSGGISYTITINKSSTQTVHQFSAWSRGATVSGYGPYDGSSEGIISIVVPAATNPNKFYYYNDSGARKDISKSNLYYYDNNGARHSISNIYYYDSSGTRKTIL